MDYYKNSANGPVISSSRPRGTYVAVKLHSKDTEFSQYRIEHFPSNRVVFHVADLKDPRWEDRLELRIWKLLRGDTQ